MSHGTPESKVKARVVKLLKALGAWYCFPVAGGYGTRGIPDILVCLKGRFIAIECKAGKNPPTALQLLQIDLIGKAWGAAFIVNEESFDRLERELRRFAEADPAIID